MYDPLAVSIGGQRNCGASFGERWESPDAYLAFLRPRLQALHRMLAPQGSLVVHLDHVVACRHVGERVLTTGGGGLRGDERLGAIREAIRCGEPQGSCAGCTVRGDAFYQPFRADETRPLVD